MNRVDVSRVVPADHVQPSPDRAGRHGDVRAAVPRSVQLQLRSADSGPARPRRRGDAQPLRRGRQAGRHEPQGLELLDLVERRAADDGLLPQHDRPADRDDRQSDADEIPFVPRTQLPDSNLHFPIAPQEWHFRQSIDYSVTANRAVLRHRLAEQGELPLQHLPDGEELDRARQPRQLDGDAAPHHRRADGASGGAPAAVAAPMPGGDEPDAPAAGAVAGGGSPEDFKKLLRDPAMRDPRGFIAAGRPAGLSRPRPSSSTRC